MYLPHHFKEERLEILLPIIQEYPLGIIVTIDQGVASANHLPFFTKKGLYKRTYLK